MRLDSNNNKVDFVDSSGYLNAEFPKKGDSLFRSTQKCSPHMNACINWTYDKRDIYARGFRFGADVLAEHIFRTGNGLDTLIFPLAFCYRHNLELSMKIILHDGWQLLDDARVVPKIHRLHDLWPSCRKIAEQVWPEGDRAVLATMTKLVNELSCVDSEGYEFRYSESKDGRTSLNGITHINIENFVNVVTKMSCLVDCISTGLAEFLQNKREMEQEIFQ